MEANTQHIIDELDEIKSLLAKKQPVGKISLIERDIVLSKLQLVYVAVSKISAEEHTQETKVSVEKSSEILKNPTLVEPSKKKSVLKENKHIEPLIVKEEKVEGTVEFLQIENELDSAKNIETIEKEDGHLSPVQDKKTIAEKFHKSEPLINELLAKQTSKKDLSSMMQSKPINDIESAIGVNERFIFLKELFNSDNETYLKTIKILNNAHNFNEAFNYLNQTFAWDFESGPAHKLLDLVRRKHIVDTE